MQIPKVPFVERRKMQEVAKHIYHSVPDNMLIWVLETQLEEFYRHGYIQGYEDAEKAQKEQDDH